MFVTLQVENSEKAAESEGDIGNEGNAGNRVDEFFEDSDATQPDEFDPDATQPDDDATQAG